MRRISLKYYPRFSFFHFFEVVFEVRPLALGAPTYDLIVGCMVQWLSSSISRSLPRSYPVPSHRLFSTSLIVRLLSVACHRRASVRFTFSFAVCLLLAFFSGKPNGVTPRRSFRVPTHFFCWVRSNILKPFFGEGGEGSSGPLRSIFGSFNNRYFFNGEHVLDEMPWQVYFLLQDTIFKIRGAKKFVHSKLCHRSF